MAVRLAVLALMGVLLTACARGDDVDRSGAEPTPAGDVAPTPDAGRTVVEVDMLTDDAGNNVFSPADLAVRQGDVIRFVLRNGVHNAHFLPDSNPGVRGLPPAGPLLQLPGQTYDVKVTWQEGRYYYQCDPHALLGMIGHVTVQAN